MRLFAPLALSLAILAGPALADTVTGQVRSYDTNTTMLILTDGTVWSLRDGGAAAPEGIKPGDMVRITYVSAGDNGFGKIQSVAVQQ